MSTTSASGVLPPEWNQFLPDLIVAGATSLAIGYVLYRLQIAREDRLARFEADAGWRRALPAVVAYSGAVHIWVDGSAELPGTVDRLDNLLTELPLSSWDATLKAADIKAAIAVTDAVAAWRADSLTNQAARAQGAANQPVPAFDVAQRQMAVGRLLLSLNYLAKLSMQAAPLVPRSPHRPRLPNRLSWLRRLRFWRRKRQ